MDAPIINSANPQHRASALEKALRANPFDAKHAVVLANALQGSGIDAVARLNCDRLLRLLRSKIPNMPVSAADRRKIMNAFLQIRVEGSAIAINASQSAVCARTGRASP